MVGSFPRTPSPLIGDRRPDKLDQYHRQRIGHCSDLLLCQSEQATPPDPADPKLRLARLEAVLFLAREPIASRKLAQLANLTDGTEARTLVRRLQQRYDARASGFQVVEVAGGFQLLTRPEFGKWLRRIQQTPVEARLSGPAMETLVVVAYCQPVLRAEIEAIRGVQCGEIVRQLMDRDLVRIAGRSDDLGRPFLYGTTKRFLQVFGLKHLDDLPRADQLHGIRGRPARPVENRQAGSHDIGTQTG
ncbi:MAG: SMC-Scp complex subunit ScpB [Pirellulales bacterium]